MNLTRLIPQLSASVLESLKKSADLEKKAISDTLCDIMLSGGNEADKAHLISERYSFYKSQS